MNIKITKNFQNVNKGNNVADDVADKNRTWLSFHNFISHNDEFFLDKRTLSAEADRSTKV